MALIGPWGFEGQTTGTIPTPANSDDFGDPAFTSVSGGGFCTYSNAQARFGLMSLQYNVTTAATASVVDAADTPASSAAAHAWIYIGASPTAEIQGPIVFRSAAGAANQARVQLTATNQLRNVFVSGPLNGTVSSSIPGAGWYRIESVVTGATGVAAAATMTTNVYDTTGALLFAVPTLTGGTANNIDTIRWGKAGGTSTVQFWLDDLRQNIGSGVEIGDTVVAVPAQPARQPRRLNPPRRARMESVQPPADVLAPPVFRGARRQFRPVRRGVEAMCPPAQVVVPPARTPHRSRTRRFAVPARRGVEQPFVPAAAAVPVAPPIVPTALTRRRVGRWLRRARTVTPTPVQAVAPAAPPLAPAGPRVRRVQALLRRRPPAVVPPVQLVAPVNPPIAPPGPRARRFAILRRTRLTTNLPVIPDQAVPPALPQSMRRRPGLPLDRRRAPMAPPIGQPVVAPVRMPRPVRRRLLGLFRRGPGREAFPVQPGNPNTLIPRPGTVEPGTRGGPSAGAGIRGGVGAGPGVRSSAGGAAGVRRGGDNEPGTRSGPTISGGQ